MGIAPPEMLWREGEEEKAGWVGGVGGGGECKGGSGGGWGGESNPEGEAETRRKNEAGLGSGLEGGEALSCHNGRMHAVTSVAHTRQGTQNTNPGLGLITLRIYTHARPDPPTHLAKVTS